MVFDVLFLFIKQAIRRSWAYPVGDVRVIEVVVLFATGVPSFTRVMFAIAYL